MQHRYRRWLFVALFVSTGLLVAPGSPLAEENPAETEPNNKSEEIEEFKVVEYGSKGLDIRSRDGNFKVHIDWRAQLRMTERDFDDPIAPNPDDSEGSFAVNRARFKMGGHAYRPWLTYYFEYDFVNSALLDLRFSLKASNAIQLRVGQWKVLYNRERVDSSGKQQFAERSIVTPWFTLDRQQGAAFYGRVWEGRRADSWYNLCVNSATGRGGSGSVDQPMVLGRWQWNFLKRDLAFSQSDIGIRELPAGSVAIGGADWRGPYTSFSTQGGGQLPGYSEGTSTTYQVSQAMVETAFQYRGFSWQQEFHWKTIENTSDGTVTDLEGWYAQAGYFLHAAFKKFPRPLEIALRFAFVDPDTASGFDSIKEWTIASNWFFTGHRNKLTLDFSRLEDENQSIGRRLENRIRLQWDVSF